METIKGETTTLKARGKNVTFFMRDELDECQINPEQWKEQNPYNNLTCVICGEKDVACLDFHHIKDKYDQVSHMQTHSLNKINQEINKCIVLCANCHRKLHYYNLTLDQLKEYSDDRF